MCLVVVRVLKRDPYCYNQNCGCFCSLRLKKQIFWHIVAFTSIHSKYERAWKISHPSSLYLYDTQTLCLRKNDTFELIPWQRVCLRVVARSPDQQTSPLNRIAGFIGVCIRACYWTLFWDSRIHLVPSYHISLTLRRLMSYIYGAPFLDVSRSHTTTQHSR